MTLFASWIEWRILWFCIFHKSSQMLLISNSQEYLLELVEWMSLKLNFTLEVNIMLYFGILFEIN